MLYGAIVGKFKPVFIYCRLNILKSKIIFENKNTLPISKMPCISQWLYILFDVRPRYIYPHNVDYSDLGLGHHIFCYWIEPRTSLQIIFERMTMCPNVKEFNESIYLEVFWSVANAIKLFGQYRFPQNNKIAKETIILFQIKSILQTFLIVNFGVSSRFRLKKFYGVDHKLLS